MNTKLEAVELIEKFKYQKIVKNFVHGITLFALIIIVLDVLILDLGILAELSFMNKAILIGLIVDFFLGSNKYEPVKCPIEIEFGADKIQIMSPKRFVKDKKFENTRFEIMYGDINQYKYNEKKNVLSLKGRIDVYSGVVQEEGGVQSKDEMTCTKSLNELIITLDQTPSIDICKQIEAHL